jgi:pimeloyl-ACP methyl ester carboxylesterase
VLIAGSGADHRGWRRLVPELCRSDAEQARFAPDGASLAATARVAVFDQRGSGESGDVPPATSAVTTAADARAVGRALLGERFAVIGESMGGMAALQLALLSPEAVSAVVLIATTAGGAGLTWPTDAFINNAAIAAADQDETSARAGVALVVSSRFQKEQSALFELLVADALAQPTSGASLDAMGSVFMTHDVAGRLGEIRVPTLVICGTEDQTHPLPNSEYLAAHIPDARLVVADGVGHFVSMEAPHRIIDEVRALL